jgi:hypothetical protein
VAPGNRLSQGRDRVRAQSGTAVAALSSTTHIEEAGMKTTLLASLLAAAFGLTVNGAIAQNADLQDSEDAMEKPTEQASPSQAPDAAASQSTPEATQPDDAVTGAEAGTDQAPDSAQQQSDIPGQSQGAVGRPEQEQTTGQGQGVKKSGGTAEAKQPDTAAPEQSQGTVGRPEEGDAGQGEGVAEQPK